MGNTKINKSDLGYMGSKTQKQIVKIMIENPKWLSIYLDCIKKDKSLFSVKYLDVIIDYTKREFETKGVTPSYAAISAFLKADICKTDEEYDEAKALNEVFGNNRTERGHITPRHTGRGNNRHGCLEKG